MSTEQPEPAETGDQPSPDTPAATFDTVDVADVLPGPVVQVLLGAYDTVKQSPSLELDEYLSVRSTHNVLDIVSGMWQLRAKLAKTVDLSQEAQDDNDAADDESWQLARGLVVRDEEAAGEAVAKVKRLLGKAKTEVRNARGAARRQGRATAEEKAAAREQSRFDQLREQRDRARSKLAYAEESRTQALARVDDLTSDLEGTRAQLVAAQHQIASLRASLTDVPTAAQRLADALTPRAQRGVVRDVRDSAADLAADLAAKDAAAATLTALPDEVVTLLRDATDHVLGDVLDDESRANAPRWLPQLLRSIARPPRLERLTELALTVDVLGGGDEIGGSCVLITGGGTRILVDCGTRPSGNDEVTMAPPDISRALAEKIDAIIVTHAHNDHGGWVPAVIAKQPHVPVFATLATCDLLTTMWNDSAKVLRSKVDTNQWKGGPLPPYSQADAEFAFGRLREVPFGQTRRIGSLDIELFQAGHIVGAAGVVVTAGEHRVVVTGDVSAATQGTVGGFEACESARFADLILLESTYVGQNAAHPRHKVVNDFVRSVELTMDAGGIALVPSFALGRAQEIALICGEYLPDVEVLVDGLARDISETYENHPAPGGGPLRIFRGNVRPVPRGKTIDEKIRLKSGIVISTSGMLSSGPAVSWAQRVLPDPASALMIVGYQDPESPGGLLKRLDRGATFNLPMRDGSWEPVQVQAKVDDYHLGAHADAGELRRIADHLAPKHLMLVHGERRNQLDFAAKIRQSGRKTTLAELWTAGRK